MSKIPGTVTLSGIIAPSDDQDTYAVTEDTYNKGGHRTVDTIADRNAIPTDRRKEGMLVFVKGDNVTYQLINGLWEVFAGSSGAGDKHYVYTQPTASNIWNVNHNMGKFPAVDVIDTGGTNVEGDVFYVDANNLTLTFSAPFTGTAYLN